jgi:4-amino-4-deoxy-L-arabinose transferase-like glycosyltransferase
MPIPRARLSWAAPAVLLAVMAALLVGSSLHKKLAYDEFDNLAYGHRFLTEGPSAPMNGQRMPVLALNAVPCLGDGCRLKTLNLSEGKRLLVRLPTMVFCLATGLLLYVWAGEMLGAGAALLALTLFAFQPTFLGHGKQVTSDTQSAFFLALTVYCVWKAMAGPRTWWWLAATGVALAAGLASKFTNILAFPVVVALAFTVPGPLPSRRRALAVLAAFATALVGINAAYLFDGTFQPGAAYTWQSQGFPHLVPPWLPIPLPRAFVIGLDYSHLLQEDPHLGRGNNYVLGELNRDGRWYAFPLMILLKTPLATFALMALALRRLPRSIAWILLLPAAVVITVFSGFVDPQLGIRYVLPALPFLVLLAAGASGASDDGPRPGRWCRRSPTTPTSSRTSTS